MLLKQTKKSIDSYFYFPIVSLLLNKGVLAQSCSYSLQCTHNATSEAMTTKKHIIPNTSIKSSNIFSSYFTIHTVVFKTIGMKVLLENPSILMAFPTVNYPYVACVIKTFVISTVLNYCEYTKALS